VHLDRTQSSALASALGILAEARDADELMQGLAAPITRLFGTDRMVSREHDARTSMYSIRIAHNLDPAHAASYDRHFQFCDPVTPRLKTRRCASFTQVFAPGELSRTEFFNDFLRVHEIHWGMNLYAHAGGRCVGDLLVFRSRTQPDFDGNDLDILRLIEPAFAAALLRVEDQGRPPACSTPLGPLGPLDPDEAGHVLVDRNGLTARESQVAVQVARGASDKEIARDLGIELSTVRYYLTNALRKLDVKGRTRLATLVTGLCAVPRAQDATRRRERVKIPDAAAR
jgi:DNA-binding CsgD family transcriptional regulator